MDSITKQTSVDGQIRHHNPGYRGLLRSHSQTIGREGMVQGERNANAKGWEGLLIRRPVISLCNRTEKMLFIFKCTGVNCLFIGGDIWSKRML